MVPPATTPSEKVLGGGVVATRRSFAVIKRRLVSIPVLFLAFVAVVAVMPIALALSAVLDVVRWLSRGHPMATRLMVFLLAYLSAEVVGVLALFVGWLRYRKSPDRLFRQAFEVQKAWAGFLFRVVLRTFALTVEVTGTQHVSDTPFVLLSRHASLIDTLLPAVLIAAEHDTHIRHVLKDELLVDPALDIAGNRLPNSFVKRGSGNTESEAAKVFELGAQMPDNEVALIYPEGTRFNPDRRLRIIESLERTSPVIAERAAEWAHVLPPRAAGVNALLSGTDCDVVVLAHHGLDGFGRISDIWRGGLVGNRILVRMTRIDRRDIPDDTDAWLFDVWADVNGWIESVKQVDAAI